MDDADDSQTPEEIHAAVAEAGHFAQWFLRQAAVGDIGVAWAAMSDDLRLTRVQCWLVNWDTAADGYDRDEVAAALAVRQPEHPLTGVFFEVEQGMWAAAHPRGSLDNLGVASRPRPVPPDMEIVLLVDLDAPPPVEAVAIQSGGWLLPGQGESGLAVPVVAAMLVRHSPTVGWELMSHNGEHLPVPGWPPRL